MSNMLESKKHYSVLLVGEMVISVGFFDASSFVDVPVLEGFGGELVSDGSVIGSVVSRVEHSQDIVEWCCACCLGGV